MPSIRFSNDSAGKECEAIEREFEVTAGPGPFIYSISGSDALAVDPDTGRVSLQRPLGPAQLQAGSLSVVVTATDPQTGASDSISVPPASLRLPSRWVRK